MSRKKSSTKEQTAEGRTKPEDINRITEKVVDLLADPALPSDLREAIEDYLTEMSNSTQVTIWTPEIARVALPIMWDVYEHFNLEEKRVVEGQQTHEYLMSKREGGAR
jgi:hypothetical protein